MIEKVLLFALIGTVIAAISYLAIRRRRSKAAYVIGQQMADAQREEEARLKLGKPASSPLPGGRYMPQPGEWGLLNPGPSDLDAQIRKSCKSFSALSKQERVEFTAAVSLEEFDNLIEFARRAAVFALRNQDIALLRDGLTALAMIQAKRTDFRDILVALALLHHTGSRIGVDPDSLLREVARIAEPEVADIMTGFAERDAQRKNLKASWGYLEVETALGKGFARWGFEPFAPTKTDLLATAMKVASIIDMDSYQTDSIELATDLPEVWLKTPGSNLSQETLSRVRAGATVSAHLQVDKDANASSQQFTVFIVEMDSPESAEVLCKLSKAKSPESFCRLGIARDRIFCLVIGRSFVQGVTSFERGESLNRFEKRIQDALSQTEL
jgi:hypothetical protein